MVRFILTPLLVMGSLAFGGATGTLVGSVRLQSGAPVPQLSLSLKGATGLRTTISGPDGRYRFSNLAPGEYTLSVDVPGLTLEQPASATVGSEETRLDATLRPAPVGEHVIVTASRDDAMLSELGVSASVLEGQEIENRDARSTVDLLQGLPGVATARSGGVGLQSSVFVRGGESYYSLVLIDGVPVNEPGGSFNFGSLSPLELDRVEVVTGAASSLYGTDALAGVIQLVTRRAAPNEQPSFRAEGEGGSFAWRRGEAGTSGRTGIFDWNLGVLRVETDNQQPNSAFRETAAAATAGLQLTPDSTLRFLARGESSTVGTPGQTAFGRPDLDASYQWKGVTLGADYRTTGRVTQSLHVGYSLMDQLSLDPINSGTYIPSYGSLVAAFPVSDFTDPLGYENNSRRLVAGYQAELQAGNRHLLMGGLDYERETGSIGSRTTGDIVSPERNNGGIWLQDQALLFDGFFVTMGGRVERNANFGTKVVPRLTAAYRVKEAAGSTTLHGSAGEGIEEPSFLQTFGTSFFALGNPNLKPERSVTFDLGAEQRLFKDRARVDVTLFNHTYYDQIAYVVVDPNTFQGSYTNLGKIRARGAEVTMEVSPCAHFSFQGHYTLLDGVILVSSDTFQTPIYAPGQSLLRRPRNSASFSARAGFSRVELGVDLVVVGERADSDFLGLGLTTNPGYTRLDARASAKIVRGLRAFVVADNLLNSSYMEVLGYPALGRSVRAGLKYRSSGDR